MRIYLAAPWKNRPEAKAAAEYLESCGHTITKRWWEHRDVSGEDARAELEQQAIEDLQGVFSAQVFVLLNIQPSEGKTVETGLALAYGTPIVVVGKNTNLFHYLLPREAFVDTIEEAERYLRTLLL